LDLTARLGFPKASSFAKNAKQNWAQTPNAPADEHCLAEAEKAEHR